MAFVFKEERKIKHNNGQTTEYVGPGTYIQGQRGPPTKENFAPFKSTVQRKTGVPTNIQSISQDMPGPGYYNVIGKNRDSSDLAALKMDNTFFRIRNKEHSNFKSKVKRFNYKKSNLPGPGQYFEQSQQQFKQNRKKYGAKKLPRSVMKKNARQILDNIKDLRQYQAIPSIPGKLHTYGYQIGNDKRLVLNVRKTTDTVGGDRKKQTVGPGKYFIPREFDKPKGGPVAFHKQSGKRSIQASRTTSSIPILGPGCYNPIKHSIPLYKYQASPQFKSKTIRDSSKALNLKIKKQQMRKTLDAQSKLKKKYYEIYHPKKQRGYSFTEFDSDDSEDSEEYIEDALPGPGYYHSEKTYSTFNTKTQAKKAKSLAFSSEVARFKNRRRIDSIVGPGSYDMRGTLRKKDIRHKKIAFHSSLPRAKRTRQQSRPGPGEYVLKNDIQEEVLQKVKKGYKGSFGTHDLRFKYNDEDDENEKPGPGAYDDTRILEENKLQKQKGKKSSQFKSKQERDVFPMRKDKIPEVGIYEQHHGSIADRMTSQIEVDPDLVIDKPPFNSKVARFKQTNQVEKGFVPLEQKELEIIKKRKAELIKQNRLPFNKAQRRFEATYHKPVPGPGKYHNSAEDTWDKRTFNILFADI